MRIPGGGELAFPSRKKKRRRTCDQTEQKSSTKGRVCDSGRQGHTSNREPCWIEICEALLLSNRRAAAGGGNSTTPWGRSDTKMHKNSEGTKRQCQVGSRKCDRAQSAVGECVAAREENVRSRGRERRTLRYLAPVYCKVQGVRGLCPARSDMSLCRMRHPVLPSVHPPASFTLNQSQ